MNGRPRNASREKLQARRARRRQRAQYAAVVVLGAVSVLLVLTNALLGHQRWALEQSLSAKQRYIDETVAVSRLNVSLIQSMANRAAASGDEGLRRLLASQGIEYSVRVSPRAQTSAP